MSTEARVKKILPALERLVSEDEKRFEQLIDFDAIVEPMLRTPGAPESEGDRQAARTFFRGLMNSTFGSLAANEEVQHMAKGGVSNALKALGYNATTDSVLDGFSGNRYYVSVMAPSEKRILIVDQTIDSSQLVGQWLRREPEVRKTFDQSRVTMGDFFKFLDISKAFGGKPSIYWLHDYIVEPEIREAIGFDPKRTFDLLSSAMANPRGSIERVVTPPSSDEAFHEMMGGIGSGISAMGQMLPTLQRIMDEKRKPLPFDVEVTAKSFLVPYISTSLLDMLEASILDPKAITDARILKGMCLELGLIDFLNPPWPDYVLDLAGGGEAHIRDAGNVLSSADKVGHPARLVEPLGILPEKVREDPHQGLEILEQKNLVVTSQKETYKLTRPGSEYVREIHKRPKVNALRKAISDLSSKISIGVKTPAGSITIEKKDDKEDD